MASIVRRLTLSGQGHRPERARAPIDSESVILKGSLKKKGHIRRNWLARYFLLYPSGLYYYKDETAAAIDGNKPLGVVTVFGCTVKEDMFQRHENVFSVFTAEGKDYHLQAQDSEEMNRWIAAIETARDKAVRAKRTDTIVQRSKSDVADVRLKNRQKSTLSVTANGLSSASSVPRRGAALET